MEAPIITWYAEIFQDSGEPIFRTMYGTTLMEAVLARADQFHDNAIFHQGNLRDGTPYVTAINEQGIKRIYVATDYEV